MSYIPHHSPDCNTAAQAGVFFIGPDGRPRIRFPGRGGWRFATAAELAHAPRPILALAGFREV